MPKARQIKALPREAAPAEEPTDVARQETGDVEDAWVRFVEFLDAAGARVTQTRRIVFLRAMARPDHFRADELAADLSKGRSRVSRATVHKTLSLMTQAGMIRSVRDERRGARYEPVWGRDAHEHMICDRCGAFIEFRAPEITEAIGRRCAEEGFCQRTHRTVVFGLCRNCAG